MAAQNVVPRLLDEHAIYRQDIQSHLNENILTRKEILQHYLPRLADAMGINFLAYINNRPME